MVSFCYILGAMLGAGKPRKNLSGFCDPWGLTVTMSQVCYLLPGPSLHRWPNWHGALCPQQEKAVENHVSQPVLVPGPLCLATHSDVFGSAVSTLEIKNHW